MLITYELEGRTQTALAHPEKRGCSASMLQAFSDSQVQSVVQIPHAEGEASQVRAHVLDDAYVGFLGTAEADFATMEDGSVRASVVEVEGTATIIEIPAGTSPSAGELDLSAGTEVPATLTATVVCPAD